MSTMMLAPEDESLPLAAFRTGTRDVPEPLVACIKIAADLHGPVLTSEFALQAWAAGLDVVGTTGSSPVWIPRTIARLFESAIAASERSEVNARVAVIDVVNPAGQAVDDVSASELVEELLRVSDLPLSRIAEALAVSRQSIYAWRAGEEPSDVNLARLTALLGAVREEVGKDKGTRKARRVLLRPNANGVPLFDSLAARVRAEHPHPKPRFTAMNMLTGADVDLPITTVPGNRRIGRRTIRRNPTEPE